MKTVKRGIIILAALLMLAMTMAACSKGEPDGVSGEYLFVYEKGPMGATGSPDYKWILDGYGGGTYEHKGSSHKIKYTYINPNIELKDTITGIKYQGTLIDGALNIFDGDPNGSLVTEFLYQNPNAYRIP